MVSAFLSVNLLVFVGYKNPSPRCCLRCGASPGYVQINWPQYGLRRFFATWRSSYCGKHMLEVNKRRRMPVLETEDEVRAFEKIHRDRAQEIGEQMEAEHKAREQKELDEHGRILRLSGYRGRMYELADESLEADVIAESDGTSECETIRVCCWKFGAWLIDNRIGGRRSPERHDIDCANTMMAEEK